MRAPSTGNLGETWVWSNSSPSANYGSVFGDYNAAINTELVLHDGTLTLIKTLANGEKTSTVIASI